MGSSEKLPSKRTGESPHVLVLNCSHETLELIGLRDPVSHTFCMKEETVESPACLAWSTEMV